MDINARVKVHFTQEGTWGGIGFKGELFYKKSELSEMFGLEEEYNITLIITEGPEQYIGLELEPGQELPGLYASGYDHPLSGKCFLGEMKVGNDAKSLVNYDLPKMVFSMNVSYLHINENEAFTDEQKSMLLEVVRFDRKRRFSAGASAQGLYTQDEMEGNLKGKVHYS